MGSQSDHKTKHLGKYARLSNIMLQFNSMCLRHAGHSDVRVQGKKQETKKTRKARSRKCAFQINQQFQQKFVFRML